MFSDYCSCPTSTRGSPVDPAPSTSAKYQTGFRQCFPPSTNHGGFPEGLSLNSFPHCPYLTCLPTLPLSWPLLPANSHWSVRALFELSHWRSSSRCRPPGLAISGQLHFSSTLHAAQLTRMLARNSSKECEAPQEKVVWLTNLPTAVIQVFR